MPHLWEVKHPYYCAEGNFYQNGLHQRYGSWAAFMEAWGDNDMDYNLLFRWDWAIPVDVDDPNKTALWIGEPNTRDCTLRLFWMLQRKGKNCSCEVAVCPADEPAVKAWLQGRYDHLKSLWTPLV